MERLDKRQLIDGKPVSKPTLDKKLAGFGMWSKMSVQERLSSFYDFFYSLGRNPQFRGWLFDIAQNNFKEDMSQLPLFLSSVVSSISLMTCTYCFGEDSSRPQPIQKPLYFLRPCSLSS